MNAIKCFSAIGKNRADIREAIKHVTLRIVPQLQIQIGLGYESHFNLSHKFGLKRLLKWENQDKAVIMRHSVLQ